jgi:hypothetical protein
MGRRRTIGFVLFDQALALNLNGSAEAFSVAPKRNQRKRRPAHEGHHQTGSD